MRSTIFRSPALSSAARTAGSAQPTTDLGVREDFVDRVAEQVVEVR
jgi:hypothetical protein